jgi:hypothetical protein
MSGNSVFISYSYQDSEPLWLNSFVDALRDRNIKVFIDWVDFKPGDNWIEVMEKALRESDTIIAVISGTTSENPNVFFELGVALGANKRLILVADPSATASIPFYLRSVRWVALQEPKETARKVAEAIGAPGLGAQT